MWLSTTILREPCHAAIIIGSACIIIIIIILMVVLLVWLLFELFLFLLFLSILVFLDALFFIIKISLLAISILIVNLLLLLLSLLLFLWSYCFLYFLIKGFLGCHSCVGAYNKSSCYPDKEREDFKWGPDHRDVCVVKTLTLHLIGGHCSKYCQTKAKHM